MAYPARIRAARAYAGLSQEELAEALGVDPQTIKRRESGYQQPKKGERVAIAAICRVPPEFMEHGFGEIRPTEIARRLAQIEAMLATRREVGADGGPSGDLGHDVQDGGPTPQSQPETQRPEEPGALGGSAG